MRAKLQAFDACYERNIENFEAPIRFMLMGGERHQWPRAYAIVDGHPIQMLTGDKSLDAADFIKALIAAVVRALIRPPANRKEER